MWRVWIIVGMTLAACAEFPEVDAALASGTPSRDYPALLPFEDLLAADTPRLDDTTDDALLARAAALRNRAAAIRGPVIDSQTRRRMEDGVTQP